ncbi:mucin TcMUCII, putative [Trypanosoma cruzi]|uniref:Mucin TcMUCII, putative n=1 Tax=Trypanosoma cruzi (strain CL Brener) TaxID=353153 RepID=Q4CTF9_TRYCC|nr:mucin TcMUCII, putative [Trypanosoma cruzi]EAN83560.1 mucin TcMUCII, putative [Trypanosoma cruzi]|eukprot:XP_805411.1 mucin TcMUCII [Trypanosoma cruzi strain CL Brener]
MMTCRLLCVLLMLALCCCSPVCAAETVGEISAGSGMSPPQSKARDNPDNGQDSLTDNGAELADSGNVEEGLRNGGSTPLKRQENTVEVPKPNTEAGALQSGSAASGAEQVLNEKPGSIQVSGTAIEGQDGKKADKEIKATTSTTSTTTTKAPTTNTTTTCEPSLLREIDGSLSSSAWVCAPLLLAVCALACTAVG